MDISEDVHLLVREAQHVAAMRFNTAYSPDTLSQTHQIGSTEGHSGEGRLLNSTPSQTSLLVYLMYGATRLGSLPFHCMGSMIVLEIA